jgi:hypothetical protein
MAGNWNALLDRASGHLVALCMDDDRLSPRYAGTCAAVFDADPELGVVFTNHSFTEEGGGERMRDSMLPAGRHDDFAREFIFRLPVAVSAAMIRREAWIDVRPLPDTAAADMVLFGRLAERRWPFHYIDQVLMTYASHAGMLSGTPGFRSDRIEAWTSLRFSDPLAEERRRRVLGDAFLSRARLHLQRGDKVGARADIRQARDNGMTGPRHRLLFTRAAVNAPSALIAGATRLRRRVRAGSRR